jgi:hypothetical protein
VKHHHPSEENMIRFGTANSITPPSQTGGSNEASSGERSAQKELADRVSKFPTYMDPQRRFEREEAEKDFASEVEKAKQDGLRFSGERGNYRVDGSIVNISLPALGNLHRLAVAAARVGEVQITRDVVQTVKRVRRQLNFDDPTYPIWKHIYEAAYEKLDPNSPAAVALKKKFGK